MKRFDIYRNGELIEDKLIEVARALSVEIENERDALGLFADANGITGPIRRDGGGLLYVGDETQGRYYARYVIPAEVIAAWRAKYPDVPFGTPVVLAEAITQSGGLA